MGASNTGIEMARVKTTLTVRVSRDTSGSNCLNPRIREQTAAALEFIIVEIQIAALASLVAALQF